MKKLSLIALLIMVLGFNAQAQVKIGYTNPERILSQMAEVVEIDAQVSLLIEQKDSLLAIKADSLKIEFEDYEASKDVLSQTQRQQREQELLQKNKEFEDERQNSLNEVQQRQIALLRPLEEKIFTAIQTVADSLGLDLVLNEGSVQGGAFIFYASDDQINITEMVLEKLKQS